MAIPCQVNAGRGTEFLICGRTWTVDKETGKVASAKNPRKWEKLFDFRSVFIDPPQVAEDIPPVRITLPDGDQIFSGHDKDINHTLSNVLGRDVRLKFIKAGRFLDIVEGRFQIDEIIQVNRKNDEHTISNKIFDFSVETIRLLFELGYNDALDGFKEYIESKKEEQLKA